MKRPKGLLRVSVDDDDENNKDILDEAKSSFQISDTTFRCEGISIGRDYLRLEGTTVTRGELLSQNLELCSNEILGRGAFSTVRKGLWRRKQGQEDVTVAVKTFSVVDTSSTQQQTQMLLTELRALCRVECPLLVQLHGAFLETGTITMVLEYMDLGSLHDFITKRAAPLVPSMIAAFTYQVLLGLEYLHETCHMIHRDLKPPNVLLHSNGAVKLCDFGIAAIHNSNRMSSSSQTPASALNTTLIGTSRFMSPERLRGRPYGRSSDMWSLGLILLECVTGESCWKDVRSLVDLVITVEEAIIEELIPAVIEEGLREIMLSCLKHQPEKRIPSKLLLQSPWFSKSHEIVNVESAMKRAKDCMKS